MATDLNEIDPLEPSPDALDRAEAAIRLGQVVAIPTDTLYALVADPFDLRAVRQIYHAKGRENQRALPLFVRDALMVEATLPLRATGNTGRLAVRQSRSRLVDELLARMNQPLVATSANLSGHPTCRSGIEVFGMMDGRVDLVLDGGPTSGVGATTLDITEEQWQVIREGAISSEEIAECLG